MESEVCAALVRESELSLQARVYQELTDSILGQADSGKPK